MRLSSHSCQPSPRRFIMLRVINIQVWRDSWGIRARNADRVIPTRSKHSQQPRGDWTVALPPDLPTTPNACGSPEACSLRQVPNSIRLSLHACLVVGARPGIRRARVCRFAAHAALGEQDHRFRRSFAIKNSVAGQEKPWILGIPSLAGPHEFANRRADQSHTADA